MASIDLSDLIINLKTTVNSPGSDAFPGATNTEWLANLQNGFWDAMVDGIVPKTYNEDGEGVVTPENGAATLSRELQQVIVLYASMNVVRNQLRTLKTMEKSKAGPVEYEIQQSANVFKALLDELLVRRQTILDRLSDSGNATDSYYIDNIFARDQSINYGYTYWVGS